MQGVTCADEPDLSQYITYVETHFTEDAIWQLSTGEIYNSRDEFLYSGNDEKPAFTSFLLASPFKICGPITPGFIFDCEPNSFKVFAHGTGFLVVKATGQLVKNAEFKVTFSFHKVGGVYMVYRAETHGTSYDI